MRHILPTGSGLNLSHQRGLTMVELLVALTISIMIALAEPTPICPRLKVNEYMNIAGKSEE